MLGVFRGPANRPPPQPAFPQFKAQGRSWIAGACPGEEEANWWGCFQTTPAAVRMMRLFLAPKLPCAALQRLAGRLQVCSPPSHILEAPAGNGHVYYARGNKTGKQRQLKSVPGPTERGRQSHRQGRWVSQRTDTRPASQEAEVPGSRRSAGALPGSQKDPPRRASVAGGCKSPSGRSTGCPGSELG